MDSLLATYASSDEEDDQPQPQPQPQSQSQNPPIQSKPAPKFGANFFSSLPPPKSQLSNPRSDSDPPLSKSLFSKLPQPKSDPVSNPKPKKVVQFRPPVITKPIDDDDDDNDDADDEKKEKVKSESYVPQAPSVKSFLSSIPAPRNSGSLGAGPSAAGTSRRSILEAEVPRVSDTNAGKDTVDGDNVGTDNRYNVNVSVESYVNYDNNVSYDNNAYSEYENVDYSAYGTYQNVGTDGSSYGPAGLASVGPGNYGGYEGYSGYESYGQYESKWVDRSGGNLEPVVPMEVPRPHGKRGRNEIPEQVIEVNQDELMKNRPREDQVKLTGIAFGPSYQPASAVKGKPSKLHKRKHQIGSLYHDMRSKEAELAERRSRGFLTKAETHAKYGW